MNLLFLGTSAGVPTKTRNVSGIALRESQGKGWYLIDCGEGTQHQVLHTKLSFHSLKTILITHEHGDHCYGLPGILASAGMGGRKAPLTIVAPAGIKAWLEATCEATQLCLPFALKFIDSDELPSVAFGSMAITTFRLSHRAPSYAYGFTETKVDAALDVDKLAQKGIPRGRLWGQLKQGVDVEFAGERLKSHDYLIFKHKPRKVVVAGDNDQPDLLFEACKGAQVLVHEATYTEEMAQKAGDVGHSYAKLVAAFAETVQLPNLVLTHFSPRYQLNLKATPSIEDIRKEAENAYSGSLYLAQDFGEYTLDKAGHFTEVAGK
ncbi:MULTISPECIES: ribonuclease Z [Halomonadaceae]|uniref:Ribonuclease Z n=1 Tax=Vreelandella titanicae TaxID=664683 RepID=A0AAP9NRL7_9GAMM|nr:MULTISPECIES: ribonuclease Z [Halomonas]QKS27030.1 Ribonuclease Z [Halomonas titanicae]CDG51399.1 Ribonuclease Z [Halomonas sp. A3H3]SDI11393.1 ribonuclease Z [Halomonas titanicae]